MISRKKYLIANIFLLDCDFGTTGKHVNAWRFCRSAYPAMAMQAPKKVICQIYVNTTDVPANPCRDQQHAQDVGKCPYSYPCKRKRSGRKEKV